MARTVRLNLWRRLALVAVAEGAEPALDLYTLANKISRTLSAVGRNNDPAPYNRIFAEFGHKYRILSKGGSKIDILRYPCGVFEQFDLERTPNMA